MTSLRMRASIASTLFLLLTSVSGAHAQDFFEELFGGAESHHSAPVRSRSQGVYRDSNWGSYRAGGGRRHREIREPRESRRVESERNGSSGSSNWSGDPKGSEPGAGAGGEFCVRACDGYVFPLIRSAQATKQESCAFACPSASVEYFHGGSIDSARNLRGQRYSELPNAFKYREQTIPGCSCHPPEESQQTSLRIARKDPTAQAGDIVVEHGGAFVFNGKRVVPIEGSHQVSASIRRDVKRMTEGPARPGFAAVVAAQPVVSAPEAASTLPSASAPVSQEAGSQRDESAKSAATTFAVAGLEAVGAGDSPGGVGASIILFILAVFAGAFAFVNRHALAPAGARAAGLVRENIAAFISRARRGIVNDPPSAWVWSSYRGVIETPAADVAGCEAVEANGYDAEAPPLAWVWSAYRGELIPEETIALPEPTTSRHEAPRNEPTPLFGPRQAAAA